MTNHIEAAEYWKLAPAERLIACAALAERLELEYSSAVRRELHGSAMHYRNALNRIWNHISGKIMADAEVYDQYERFRPFWHDWDFEVTGVADTGYSYDGTAATCAIISAITSCAMRPSIYWKKYSSFDSDHGRFLSAGVTEMIRTQQPWNTARIETLRELCQERPLIDWISYHAELMRSQDSKY